MWNNSTQTTWQCNDCNYVSESPMRVCINCDSSYISKHEVNFEKEEDFEKDDVDENED